MAMTRRRPRKAWSDQLPGAQRPARSEPARVVWEVHERPIPVYDDAFEGAAHAVLCVEAASGAVLAIDIVPPEDATQATVAAVLKALRVAHPDVILVQRPELAEPLLQALTGAGVQTVEVRRVRSLPGVREALRVLGERLGFDPDGMARYWRELARTYPDLQGLMADAAAFFRVAPWEWLTESHVLRGELVGLRNGSRPLIRYLAVLGALERPAGLAAFATAAGARSALAPGRRRLDRVAALYVPRNPR